MADGGVCTTLRDLARFGQVLLNGGRRGTTTVIPRAWLKDTLTPDADSRTAFEDHTEPERKRHYVRLWLRR